MVAIRSPWRKPLLLPLLIFLSGCAAYPDIPLPTAPRQRPIQVSQPDGITAPPQKAWEWDANRWFTAELDHRCRGPIRFVDEKNGIDSYVGDQEVPHKIFASDDPDVILATIDRAYEQLVFSTDGGRHFVQEVRGLPRGPDVKFAIVRHGHVYVGMEQHDYPQDGYFKWQQPGYRSKRDNAPAAMENSLLVILEAPIDKAAGRIGRYMVVSPTDYQFRSREQDENLIRRISDIDSLGLPHAAGVAPSDACERTLRLPPWYSSMGKSQILEFYAWYEAMKVAHPGWAGPETDAFIAWHRKWYSGVLNRDEKTPTR